MLATKNNNLIYLIFDKYNMYNKFQWIETKQSHNNPISITHRHL